MPGWAGSSWYWLRYMDANNENEFASQQAIGHWQNVDLYIGGSEHATGHLLYSRFWTKFLYDRGFLKVDEPFKKLINQGMILGESAFLFISSSENPNAPTIIVSANIFHKSSVESDWIDLKDKILTRNGLSLEEAKAIKYRTTHVDVSFVNVSNELNIEAFKNWRPEYKDAHFIT